MKTKCFSAHSNKWHGSIQKEFLSVRVDYDARGQTTRLEHFLVPYKKEDEVLGIIDRSRIAR